MDYEELGAGGYRATGCGLSTTYVCVLVQWDTVCHRNGELIDHRHKLDTAPTAHARRDFDEKRKLHFARLDLSVPLARLDVVLVGVPQAQLTTVRVKLERPLFDETLGKCRELAVLINGEPFAGANVKGEIGRERYRTTLSADFDFSVFRALARPYTSLAFRACGQRTEVAESLMVEVRKFFVLFSQIATDVQKHEVQLAPAAAPPGEIAL
ncbi:MAG TPA: hypothetical protein VF331_12315 [Polyangiales bacterium]